MSKFVSINAFKGVMKIFVDINNKKIESENKSELNYYLVKFKDIEIKDEFQEFNFKIVNNIEVKMNMKVKNKFNSEKIGNLFQKFQPGQNNKEESSQPKSVIGTGVNMKERLAMFSNINKKDNNNNTKPTNTNNYIPKKLKIPFNFDKEKTIPENKNENVKEIKKDNNEKKEEIKEQKNKEKEIINQDNKGEKREDINNKNQKENKEKPNENTEKIKNNEEIKENKIEEEIKENLQNEENLENTNKEVVQKEKEGESIKENEENIKEEEVQKEIEKEIINEKEENIKEEETQKDEEIQKCEEIKRENEEEETNKENEDFQKEKEEDNKDNEDEIKDNDENKENPEANNLEEFSSDNDDYDAQEEDEVPNININQEIKRMTSKEEELKIKNPIDQEKNIFVRNLQKRTSHIFNFTNPLQKDPTPQGKAEKQEVQKSQKILEKSNMFKNFLQKKNSSDEQNKDEEKKEKEKDKENEGQKNGDFFKRNASLNIEKINQKSKKKIEENFGLTPTASNQSVESLNDDISLRTVSTEFSSCRSFVPEIVLDSMTYDKYIEKLKQKGQKEEDTRESFCEGFFLASFPYKNGQVIEKSNDIFPALCKHKECSKLNAMKAEILIRYPLEDTKNLELNNLAATICFPTGIKICYSQDEPPEGVKDYITNITNQKGERYYMMTYHFYRKMMNDEYTKKYEMHPLKHQLMRFGDAYLTFREEEFTKEIVQQVQQTLEFCQDLGFREYVYVPYCLCLISKYPYSFEMEKCLQSIFKMISDEKNDYNFEINDLIMYLINSVPIPDKNSLVKFYLPYCDKDISLRNTKINGLNIMYKDFAKLTHIFSVSKIIIIFRLLLSEKKVLFIDDNYTTLSKVTDAFISLLYPFKWVHTYIPIMSEQMLKYLESFLPFVNGINTSLMPLVKNIFSEGEIDESEEVFLVYIKENHITIGSHLKNKKIKTSKYIQNNVISLPSNVEKELKKKLVNVQDKYESYLKNPKKKNSIDINQLDCKFRDAFIDVFVALFYDYQQYIGLLEDDEVIFNKNLFMQSVKKEVKPFYDSFLDSQLFEQFTQNFLTSDCDYFNKKVESFGKKEKSKEKMSISSSNFGLERNYIVKPDFLKLDDDSSVFIEKTMKEKFKIKLKTNENGIILPSERNITNLKEISKEKYDNSKCFIYLLNNDKKDNKNNKQEQVTPQEDFRAQFLKKINAHKLFPTTIMGDSQRRKAHLNTIVKKGALSDKKKEMLKDEIKEWVIKIFKSEVDDYKKNPKIKTDVLSLINSPIGIKIFVDLISHNNQSVTLLQKNSFKLLGFIMYNGLLFLLNCDENDQVIEECVLLYRCTRYFSANIGGKNKTFMDVPTFKSNMKKYVKIYQKNFWMKWFDIELKERQNNKKKKDEDDFEDDSLLKQETLLNVCSNMIDLEIPKITVKNYCDDLNDKYFGKTTDLGKKLSDKYIKCITSAKYISKTI